uniref:Leukotriene B4 receptor 1-like n=1 Tax=Petromyzon marinus TaxID=7757 RepID=A0AAJ7UGL3_PETMA|nr:leukotriene B4 receptor 1-like [Petromyzon marinus]
MIPHHHSVMDNSTAADYDFDPGAAWLDFPTCILLGLSSLLGLPSYLALLWTFRRTPREPDPARRLLLHLATCDGLLSAVLPFWVVNIAAGRWPFGLVACKALSFGVYAAATGGSLWLTALASHLLAPPPAIAAWGFTALSAVPWLIVRTVKEVPDYASYDYGSDYLDHHDGGDGGGRPSSSALGAALPLWLALGALGACARPLLCAALAAALPAAAAAAPAARGNGGAAGKEAGGGREAETRL